MMELRPAHQRIVRAIQTWRRELATAKTERLKEAIAARIEAAEQSLRRTN